MLGWTYSFVFPYCFILFRLSCSLIFQSTLFSLRQSILRLFSLLLFSRSIYWTETGVAMAVITLFSFNYISRKFLLFSFPLIAFSLCFFFELFCWCMFYYFVLYLIHRPVLRIFVWFYKQFLTFAFSLHIINFFFVQR